MATHQSAIKKTRRDEKLRLVNRMNRSKMRNKIKLLRKKIEAGNKEEVQKLLPQAIAVIDSTIRKGTIHRNAGARYKSRLISEIPESGHQDVISMPLPRGYISHNQVRSYIDCPRKYCFAYVEEIPPLLNDKILLGQAFHSALEHYFGKRIQNLAVERAEVFAIFNDVFATLKESENVSWSVPPGPTCERGQAFPRLFFD